MTSEYCLIFNEPYDMFSLRSFLHLFKGAKKKGFCFVFTEMNAQLVIHKPVADVWKFSIQLLFYYINVIITIYSLYDIIYVE